MTICHISLRWNYVHDTMFHLKSKDYHNGTFFFRHPRLLQSAVKVLVPLCYMQTMHVYLPLKAPLASSAHTWILLFVIACETSIQGNLRKKRGSATVITDLSSPLLIHVAPSSYFFNRDSAGVICASLQVQTSLESSSRTKFIRDIF